jgi:hypothetical protein
MNMAGNTLKGNLEFKSVSMKIGAAQIHAQQLNTVRQRRDIREDVFTGTTEGAISPTKTRCMIHMLLCV